MKGRFVRQIEDKKNDIKINVFYYRGWFLELPVTVGNFYKMQEEIDKFEKEIDSIYEKYKSINEVFNKQLSFEDLEK